MGTDIDQVRLAALHQAAHDLKGSATAAEVVERANVYLAFLSREAMLDTLEAMIKAMSPMEKGELDRILGLRSPERSVHAKQPVKTQIYDMATDTIGGV